MSGFYSQVPRYTGPYNLLSCLVPSALVTILVCYESSSLRHFMLFIIVIFIIDFLLFCIVFLSFFTWFLQSGSQTSSSSKPGPWRKVWLFWFTKMDSQFFSIWTATFLLCFAICLSILIADVSFDFISWPVATELWSFLSVTWTFIWLCSCI